MIGLTLRTAVIGVGYLGKFHAQKYTQFPACSLVGVADSQLETAATLAQTLQTTAYRDYRDLLDKVDAVSIVTPTPSHFTLAAECLSRGIHVLLEKPITHTVDEANQLIELAHKNGCILQVGHLERFNPGFIELQKRVEHAGWLETRRMAPFQLRGSDVNVIYDLMIHDIDLVLSLNKTLPCQISASGASVFSSSTDIAQARLVFENGCIANLTASRIHPDTERTLQATQDRHLYRVNFQEGSLTIFHRDNETLVQKIESQKRDAIYAEISAFIDAITQGKAIPVSGEAGRDALAIASQITHLIESPKESA